jgi:hypothetical protein
MVGMKSGSIRLFACILAAVAVPVSFGAKADRQQVQAQVLDRNEYLCANCFFGSSDFYFCFAAGGKVLIGEQKIPTLNWVDDTKNYFTKVHKSWTPWTAPGQPVQLSYDDKHIWVARADGKDLKLRRDYTHDLFSNPQCRSAVKKPSK